VVHLHEPAVADDHHLLAGEPHRCPVADAGEAEVALAVNLPRCAVGEYLRLCDR